MEKTVRKKGKRYIHRVHVFLVLGLTVESIDITDTICVRLEVDHTVNTCSNFEYTSIFLVLFIHAPDIELDFFFYQIQTHDLCVLNEWVLRALRVCSHFSSHSYR